MASVTGKERCFMCGKEKATLRCGGCLREFCFNHLGDHRQELLRQFDDLEVNCDIFRHSLNQHIEQPKNNNLIQDIDQWEHNSLQIIRQTAEEARQRLIKNSEDYNHQLEVKLNELIKQLQESRQQNDFNEINLRQFHDELDKLTKELNTPSNIFIREETTSFISKISVQVTDNYVTAAPNEAMIHENTRWTLNGIVVAGGNGFGNALNQLSSPCGVYVGDDQTIYVADNLNHRIVSWKCGGTNGQVAAGGNGQGNEIIQLNSPTSVIIDKERNNLIICDQGNRRVVQWSCQNNNQGEILISDIACWGLAMDINGYLYVSDRKKNEVKRWKIGDTDGILVAGGNGQGDHLNQLNEPAFIFVDDDQSVYVSDCHNHRVMKWMKDAKEGIIVAGGQGEGNILTQLSCPEAVSVDHLGTVYVADYNNHRIMRWLKGAVQGDVIAGGNGRGHQENQLNNPIGLSFDCQGNLYVADWNNHRIQRFNVEQN